MATTPDVEATILALLATLLPADIVTTPVGSRTAMAGPLRPSTLVGASMVFVQASGGGMDWHNDASRLTAGLTVVTRGDRMAYEATRALATRIHDALHLCGERNVGGVKLIDVRATGALPVYIGTDDADCETFIEAFDVVLEVAL